MVNLTLENKNWRKFVIGDLFDAKRPISRKEDDYNDGEIPFIASGAINNGVTKFCIPKNSEILDNGNCLSISPVDGSCYYHPYNFLGRGGAGSSVILLYARNFSLDRYVALFISKAITQTTATKYNYGHMASLDRIKKDKIYLPVNVNEEIDFQFMSSFMRQKEQQILKPTLEKLCKRLIIKDICGGGGAYSTPTGKLFILPRCLLKFSGVSDSRKPTTQRAGYLMYLPRPSIMASMDLSVTMVA